MVDNKEDEPHNPYSYATFQDFEVHSLHIIVLSQALINEIFIY